ncbi:helix-turn-helix transcriptional regulator [Microbacterium sp. NEAU-LLC]|uniref:Helix-turn-helix transcriptional regulator n=1 Tax=Microbacterium helvum TaxID=2773713 RepID=A0ABR8NSK8_9MICO|nr:TetR/AcrR family transcriptional regulator [Microbacterium helvum]MBD3943614.1 helix-turn-helix transcriptional regulator [Microbacterium helvum]
MSSASGARRADAVRNRDLALAAAKSLLADPGAPLTVEAIAKRAGLGVGTVARAFGSKDALLDAAIAELLEPLVRRARAVAAAPAATDALRTLLVEVIDFEQRHSAISEQTAGLSLPQTTARERELRDALRQVVETGREAGDIRSDIPAETTAALLTEAVHAVTQARTAPPGLADAMVAVVLDGLRP